MFFSCQDRKTNEEPLMLSTTDIKELMAEINLMPIHEIEYQIEIDKKGNTIDTTSKKLVKYYPKNKIAYSHSTRYSNDDEYVVEQYFIPNSEFIYNKTSSRKLNFTQSVIPEIDSTGLVLGLTMYYEADKKADTIAINYNYTFNKINERERLIIGAERDTMSVSHYIHYKNNQAVREYDIANNDTTSIGYSVYKKGVITESVYENLYDGHLRRRKESYYNKDGNLVSSSIYNYPKGEKLKSQEFTYKYDKDKRLNFIEEKTPPKDVIHYYKFEYVKK